MTEIDWTAAAEREAALLRDLSNTDEHGGDHYDADCVVCNSPGNAASLLEQMAAALTERNAENGRLREHAQELLDALDDYFGGFNRILSMSRGALRSTLQSTDPQR